MTPPPFMKREPKTASQPSLSEFQYRTTSRQSSDSSAIMITTASPPIC